MMAVRKSNVSKKIVVQAIIDKVENDQKDVTIQTGVIEGYPKPEKITDGNDENKSYIPDVVLLSDDHTELYEVELENEFELDKWKIFSSFTAGQEGHFNIVTPEESLPRVRETLKSNNIDAKIIYFT